MARTQKRANPSRGRPAMRAAMHIVRPIPSHDDIAARAYELFVRRGGQHGSDWEDWLLAERELSAHTNRGQSEGESADYAG